MYEVMTEFHLIELLVITEWLNDAENSFCPNLTAPYIYLEFFKSYISHDPIVFSISHLSVQP